MTKKAKKRRFDEIQSNNEEHNVKNKKKTEKGDKASPKKKTKISNDISNAKEKETNLSKDLQETNLILHKLKKKKNKKHKKHEKLDGIEPDVFQNETKKKKKSKKDKKHEKNTSEEIKSQDTEYTSKSKKKNKKTDTMDTKVQDTESTKESKKKNKKTDTMDTKVQDTESTKESKKKHEKIEAIETKNQDIETASKSKKKKDKRHKKHKQADKLVEKLESTSKKSDKPVNKVEKVISSKRKTKFKLKREEFRKQRKLIRQEEGQFSSINKLSLEEMKQKIAEIESRESLSNNALRKLRSLKKKVQVEEEGIADNVKSQKRKIDELDHKKDHKNKKIKKDEVTNTTKSFDSTSKNKKGATPKNDINLSKKITEEQLYIEDRVGSTLNEDNQDKAHLKQTKKELFVEDKAGIASPKNKIGSPQKKHKKFEVIKSKLDTQNSNVDVKLNKEQNNIEEFKKKSAYDFTNKHQINGKNKKIKIDNVDFEDGSYDDPDKIQGSDSKLIKNLSKNVQTKKVEVKKNQSPELKMVNKKKLKSEIKVNSDIEEGELEESDSEDDFNNKSNQLSLKKETKANNKGSPKNLKCQKNNKTKIKQKVSDKEEGELEEDDSDDSIYNNSNNISLKQEIKANVKSLNRLNIQNSSKQIFDTKYSDVEEGELEENDSDGSSHTETNDISLKKEIKANNKESLRSLKNQQKNKKFEQKSSDMEEGELEESASEENDVEDSDSEESSYSESDETSVKEDVIINQKESPQSLKNIKKKNMKFEPKKSSDKEEGELEESISDNELKSQSDITPSNLQAEHSLKQKEHQNQSSENSAKKQRYVLFLGNLAYETTTVDLKKHFLTKVTKVKDVRIPLDPKTRKPRGFGYIEVENSEDYEKALSLHGTFVRGRPIKIQYTTSGSKKAGNRKEIIHKNKKLHALRKAGKLAGSKKDSQKRSFRRNFKKEKTQQ